MLSSLKTAYKRDLNSHPSMGTKLCAFYLRIVRSDQAGLGPRERWGLSDRVAEKRGVSRAA